MRFERCGCYTEWPNVDCFFYVYISAPSFPQASSLCLRSIQKMFTWWWDNPPGETLKEQKDELKDMIKTAKREGRTELVKHLESELVKLNQKIEDLKNI